MESILAETGLRLTYLCDPPQKAICSTRVR